MVVSFRKTYVVLMVEFCQQKQMLDNVSTKYTDFIHPSKVPNTHHFSVFRDFLKKSGTSSELDLFPLFNP
jgi:hypothetical protein